jgi:deoxyxylulose-5-phosphate synthase
MGGFGSAVIEFANDSGIALQAPIKRFGVQDEFVPHATQSEQHEMNGYDTATLIATTLLRCSQKRLVA